MADRLSQSSSFLTRVLVVSGLSVAAFAAPVLDIYGRNPEVFVANRTSPWEIAAFALIVTLGVPLVAALVLLVAERVSPKVGDIAYRSLVVLLSLGVGLVVSRQVFADSTVAAMALALAIWIAVFLLHRRFEGVLAWFAVIAPLVLIMFLATTASARLIWAQEEDFANLTPIEDPAPIVMIQLDEMPVASIMNQDGTVNDALFPNFARLAEQGTWYRNALSDSIATTQSVPAILTGARGEKGMSPSAVDFPDNLFSLLAGNHQMHVIEWVAALCPEETCPEYAGRSPARFSSLILDVGVVYGHLSLPAELRERLPSIDNAWKGFLGQSDKPTGSAVEVEGVPVPPPGSRAQWIDWIQRISDGIDEGGKPILSYAHLQAPHVPWRVNPSGTHYDRPEEYTEVEGVEGNGHWGPEPAPALLGFQRHLYQLGFLDTMLGSLFERMDETGDWDRSMVIVVADHGASFVPGQHRRWPKEDNRDDLYRVPLFVKYPGQSVGETRDEPAFGADLVPTIVDVMGITTNWDFDGVSLLDLEGTDRPHTPIWWCCSGKGASTDVDVLFQQVERNHRWIPNQDSWLGVAGTGRWADLVGLSVDSIEVLNNQDLRWSLDDPDLFTDIEISDGKVQTLITGRIELPVVVTADEILLVANGTIAGVGYITRDSASGGSIRGLLAEETLNNGPNNLDILVRMPDSETWWSGTVDVLTVELYTSDGRKLEIGAEGSRRIQVDKVESNETGWTVTGWAADVTRKEVADTIFIFVGDELLTFGPPNIENRNVVGWFDSEDLLNSGFSFDVASANVPSGVEQLTVVAEFGSNAVSDPVRIPR